MIAKTIIFESHGDERGQLVALDDLNDVPFKIRRVYYMYKTSKNAIRGKHAHKSLEQILICTSGECKVLLDDGRNKEVVRLYRPNEGLFLSGNIWREMYDFSDDAVLMVLASEIYNEDDYIRNYEDFLEYVGAR